MTKGTLTLFCFVNIFLFAALSSSFNEAVNLFNESVMNYTLHFSGVTDSL